MNFFRFTGRDGARRKIDGWAERDRNLVFTGTGEAGMIQKNCLRGSAGRVAKSHGVWPAEKQKSMPRTVSDIYTQLNALQNKCIWTTEQKKKNIYAL